MHGHGYRYTGRCRDFRDAGLYYKSWRQRREFLCRT